MTYLSLLQTLATVLATIPVLFFSRYTPVRRTDTFFHVAGTDLDDSSTVAQIAERFDPNTVLWAFHTIQPSS